MPINLSRKFTQRCLAVFFATLNLSLCLGQSEIYSWKSVAIGGGGFVSGIVTSKTEQNLMYARTDVGGAYRWDATNQEWIPLLDWVSENELGFLGVESIAINPVSSNKVYMLVGTSYFNNGKTAILRSENYGNTFSVVDVSSQFKAHGNGMGRQTGEKLQVDPNNPDILYCGTRANGLFKSMDQGLTWARVSSLNIDATVNGNGISFVVLDKSSSTAGNATQAIIVGVSQMNTNIYRSNNGGNSFAAVTGGPTNLMPHRAVLTSDRKLFITYANNAGPWDINQPGQIWKYDLTSNAWTNVTPSGFSGAFGGISVDPSNPQRLIASSINTYQAQDGSWGDRIFLSTNGGTSWIDVVARGFDIDPNGSPWIDGQAIHWAGSIEFDPFDTKRAWVISGNGIFSSDNVDATTNVWKFKVKGLEETVPLDIVSIPNGPMMSVIGDYDGFRHTDVNAYAPIHQPRIGSTYGIAYAALNPNVVLRLGNEKMFYSEDMGLTWTECVRTGTKGSVDLSADAKTWFYSPEGSGKSYRSIDKGSTWTEIQGLNISWARITSDPRNPMKQYAYNNSNGNFFVSVNSGVSFSQTASLGSGGSKIIRAVPDREGDVWVPLYSGGLSRSTNGGGSFTKLSNVSYCGAVGFGKNAVGKNFPTIFIWGTINNVPGIHRSVDEGVTWQRVNDDAHEYGGPGNGQFVIGDMNVFGRVYMSSAGRGIIFGESNLSCQPEPVKPQIKVNDQAPKQTAFIDVSEGDNIVLSPLPLNGGTWSWSGPNNFTSSTREISFANITLNQSGIYQAIFVNDQACTSAFQTFTIQVTAATDVEAIEGIKDRFQIHPNPVTNELVIENAEQVSAVSLYNLTGLEISSDVYTHGNSMSIDTCDLPVGIYFLKVRMGKQDYFSRVIKN
jgi:xyloglucan-specific exo-beta-1,4-glucanase